MSLAQVELARALVALPSWRWGAGMLARGGGYGRSGPWGTPWLTDLAERVTGGGPPHVDNAYPDLTDAATGGVLLERLVAAVAVRGRSDDHSPYVLACHDPGDVLEYPWCVELCHVQPSDVAHYGVTLAEAAARALIALEGA